MTRNILPSLTLIISMLFLVACTPISDPLEASPDEGNLPDRGANDDFQEETSNHMAIIEYWGVDFSDPVNIEKYSRANILVVNPYVMWAEGANESAIASMKALNPDLKVIGYFNSQTSWIEWSLDSGPGRGTYENDWANAVQPYWSYTTTGDTMLAWPGKVLVNILDEDCREAMVGVLANHWTAHSNVFDGIFWDHFNSELWVMESVAGRDGELDLDGDGIAHLDDEDEMQAYREASVDLIQRSRNVLGNDIIQVSNGNRAARDSVFASILDGTMYERFPDVGFYNGREQQALDPEAGNNLFAVRNWFRQDNGGPYVILSNTSFHYYPDADGTQVLGPYSDFCRVVALLTGNYVTYHTGEGNTNYGWPSVELNLGAPLGGVSIDGMSVSREFENGQVLLDFSDGRSQAPFSYWIWQSGSLVQQMDLSLF